MRKNIYVVGGNGFARECYAYINRVSELKDKEIIFAGFLGEGGYVPNLEDYPNMYKGDMSNFTFSEDDYVVIGSGDPLIRKRIYEYLKGKGVKFYTLIDPTTIIFPHSEIGEANIFVKGCIISSQTKIGNGNLFNGDNSIGHDVVIGDFNFLAPGVQMLGHSILGDLNSVGTSSVVLPNAKVGNRNKIAPISAIYTRCKDNGIYMGNPARKMGEVE